MHNDLLLPGLHSHNLHQGAEFCSQLDDDIGYGAEDEDDDHGDDDHDDIYIMMKCMYVCLLRFCLFCLPPKFSLSTIHLGPAGRMSAWA